MVVQSVIRKRTHDTDAPRGKHPANGGDAGVNCLTPPASPGGVSQGGCARGESPPVGSHGNARHAPLDATRRLLRGGPPWCLTVNAGRFPLAGTPCTKDETATTKYDATPRVWWGVGLTAGAGSTPAVVLEVNCNG